MTPIEDIDMEDQGRKGKQQGTRSEAERQTWSLSGLAGMQVWRARLLAGLVTALHG